ncbi:MAG: phenylalanine 4-monooxygenase [Alphaproteobacteria bacterium]|nr:phenylalanine 4-monooxygenase [Alphaproteobacteria bacterium]
MARYEEHPADMRADYTIDQHWDQYTPEEHAMWRALFERQSKLVAGRACKEYLDGLNGLGITLDGIPDFERVSDLMEKRTGWRLVTVPGLIPEKNFFEHLTHRRFPVTYWIRPPEKMDYLQEPDVFHDLFGHVPLLVNPIFADYMHAFGEGGLKALKLDALNYLGRLYWFTVEFGLINTAEGLRIYGSGIVSSKTETVYCLESPIPNRIGYDTLRIMRTDSRIDALQETYFVIDNFEQLFEATRPDFTPYYEKLKTLPDIPRGQIAEGDIVLHRGTGVAG